MVAISGTIYIELLPWEPIFYVALVVFFLTLLSLLLRALRRGRKRRPTKRVLLLLICVALIAAPFLVLARFPQRLRSGQETNVAETSQTPAFPELRTRHYQRPPTVVYDAALKAVQAQLGWRLVEGSRQRGRLQVEIQVPPALGIFTDDLVVHISQGTGRRATVNARSRSRVGRGDLGENRRHILQLFKALEEQLPR